MTTSAPVPTSTRRTVINVVLALIGALLLVTTVRRVGIADVRSSLTEVGWWYFAILTLGGLRFCARARAWQVCANGERLSIGRAVSAILAADALGNLTPFGMLASEPSKVYFVNDRVSTVAAVSSVAAENAFYMTTVLMMIAGGALAFFSVADVPPALKWGAQVVLGLVMIGGLTGLWIIRRQPAILSRVARVVAYWSGRDTTAPDRLREIEVHFYAVLTWPWLRIAHAAAWEAAFHVAAVAEVFLVLRLLPTGQDVTLLQAFILETAGRLIVVAFKFVPYRLGVDEAGSAMVARALALDPTLGVALALVRRLRVLFWNAIGLALLAVRR